MNTALLLVIDGDSILASLKIALLISGPVALFLGFIMPMRLHTVWKRTRPARITMACDDPQAVRFRLLEAVKQFGYRPPQEPEGPFTPEPSNWRKKFGVSAITVDFPQPHVAVISGQAVYLSAFARSRGVPLMAAPNAPPFGKWLVPKMMPFAWVVGALFVAIFAASLAVGPPAPGRHRANELSPGELETPALRP